MPPAVVLDPREARPLTSREISKVLSAIIAGVVTVNPRARGHVAAVVSDVIQKTSAKAIGARHCNMVAPSLDIAPSWAVAFSATVSGLNGWCDPGDVQTALRWVSENLNLICSSPAELRS
jgi:hypothetical protein